MSKIDKSLFQTHTQASSECPECGGQLVIKSSKKGPFLGCSHYPECDYSKPLGSQADTQIIKELDTQCPECDAALAVKNGRFGMFIGCTAFPECDYLASLHEPKDQLCACPKCQQGQLVKRSNKYGKTFYSCDGYPRCKYTLNHKPVATECPACHWPIMTEKKTASGVVLQCPQKSCMHKLVES